MFVVELAMDLQKTLISELREVFTWVTASYPLQVGPQSDLGCPALDFEWAAGVRGSKKCEDCQTAEPKLRLTQEASFRWCGC